MNNRYLEKISEHISIREYTDNLNNESRSMIHNLGGEIIDVDGNSNKFLRHLVRSNGGHAMRWSINKDSEGNLTDIIKVFHTKPTLGVRFYSPVYSIFQSKEDAELTSAMGLRHEAYEASEIKNRMMPIIHKNVAEGNNVPHPKNLVIKNILGIPVSDHANLAVIMLESNIVNSSPYKDRLTKLFKVRHAREGKLLKELTGKEYGDHFTEEDLAKGRHY